MREVATTAAVSNGQWMLALALHGDAYGWQPPDIVGLERLVATRMRQSVRAWINEWDLIRLDPDYRPTTGVIEVASDYREDAELSEDDA